MLSLEPKTITMRARPGNGHKFFGSAFIRYFLSDNSLGDELGEEKEDKSADEDTGKAAA
jgi:hypothetical protein